MINIPPLKPENTLTPEQVNIRKDVATQLTQQNKTISSLLENINNVILKNDDSLITIIIALLEENDALKKQLAKKKDK